MEVNLVRVFRKGCLGYNVIGVVYQPNKMLTVIDMEQIAIASKLEDVVFITQSDRATIRLRFFRTGVEHNICFISMFASIHLLTNISSKNNLDKSLSIETAETYFDIDVMTAAFRAKDCELINRANDAFDEQNAPFWVNKNQEFNGYQKEKFLLEIPDTFVTKPVIATHLIETMLIESCDADEIFYELAKILQNPKFRMQIRFNDNTVENFFLSFYIQDIHAGRMIHFESISKMAGKIDV